MRWMRAIAATLASRFPSGPLIRLLIGVLIAVSVGALALGFSAGYVTYRIVTEHNDTEVVTPASYLLSSYVNLNFTDRSGGEHEGWLLLGLRGAPVILLCHGYNSNRSELVSLGILLRENHFNVYLFNFRSLKEREPYSALGLKQASDLLAAIDAITRQPAVNPRRVGLFGASTGGYAALVAAPQSSRVKALVVDTIYETPEQMFRTEVDRRLGGSSSIFRTLSEVEFHLFFLRMKPPVMSEEIPKLGVVPKLFISGRDEPSLAAATEDLYNYAGQPKRLLVLEHSQTSLTSGAEKKEYENQILTFFLSNLPLRAD